METTLEVVEQSQVAQVRRLAAELGNAQKLSSADIGRAALVATELSTNLVKYGKLGSVTVSPLFEDGCAGLQFIAVDKGPGLDDLQAAVRDGHSTGGSLGIGLGAAMRASDLFDMYSVATQGSVFFSRVLRDRALRQRSGARLVLGARRAPMRGETECGDAWSHVVSGPWERFCIVDGLGHGPLAASASAQALEVFQAANVADTPAEIVARCHDALRSTRGAVMAVAAVDRAAGRLCFAGVGNIAAVVRSRGVSHHLTSTEGIVGYNMRTVRDVERVWSAGDTLILSTDGLSGRWNFDRYPHLMLRHPVLVASVFFRDYGRDSDDATILVAQDPG